MTVVQPLLLSPPMRRVGALVILITTAVFTISLHGQAPSNPNLPIDPSTFCKAYGEEVELIFVGRPDPPVTLRISGETEIEAARQNLIRTEAEVARLRSAKGFEPRSMANVELEARVAAARSNLDRTQIKYPPAYDLRFAPIHVERVLHGVVEPTVMLLLPNMSTTLESAASYLISGGRSKDGLAPFPEMSQTFSLSEYIRPYRVFPVETMQHELEWLSSNGGRATILGTLHMQSFSDVQGAAISGVRIVVTSGTQRLESTTGSDGGFTVSGVEPGRVTLSPLLERDLTVVNPSALTFQLKNTTCKMVWLSVAVNGRLRGRISSAPGILPSQVELVLQTYHPGEMGRSSHEPITTIHPNEDGTYEFAGQGAGSYMLSAHVTKVEDGKTRHFTTFFPGTPDPAAAAPIVIGNATLHEGFDFTVLTE